MYSVHRLSVIAILLVALAASSTPAVAKTPIAPASLPIQIITTGARTASDPTTSDPTASAASLPAIEHVDNFGGIISTVAISGTYALLIQGGTLTIVDASAPATPTRIGRVPLVRNANSLTVADGIVYVAAQTMMQIIDARNPALPVETSRFQAQGYLNDIQVAGSFAYLNEGFTGIEVVDIHDPSRPAKHTQYAPLAGGGSFRVVGDLAYVTNLSNVLTILDISNPAAPITRGTFRLPNPAQTAFERVVVAGNRAYIGAFTSLPAGSQPRLVTLDVAHPESPQLLGNVEVPAALVAVAGNIAYFVSNTQLQLFDVGDPAQPVARGTYAGALHQAFGPIVQVAENRVYFVEDLATLKILDSSNPTTLPVLGSYATLPRLRSPARLQIAGSTGYLLSQGLQILDLTNPISPTLRGFYPAELAIFAQVAGSHAYIDTSSSALDLLDVSNPDLPTRIATLALNSAQAVAEANNRAYILTAEIAGCGKFCIIIHHLLNIFDISNPSAPVSEGRIPLFDTSSPDLSGIVLKGGLAYVVGGGALRVVDVSVPVTPVVRATHPLAGTGNLIQMVGNLVYVTTSAGLAILDLTDPLKPSLLGQTGSLGYPDSLQVQGSLAVVGGTGGVRVVDISDPRRPIARAADGDWIGRAAVLGDIIYVAEGAAGLAVLRLHTDRFPPPAFVPLARHY